MQSNYEYCIDFTNDNACSGLWISMLDQTTVSSWLILISGYDLLLAGPGRQCRRHHPRPTAAPGGASPPWLVPPAAFGKTAPANGATGQSLTPQLSWGTSQRGRHLRILLLTPPMTTLCGGTWTSTAGTSVTLAGLTSNTTYYWQVRAVNPDGTTHGRRRHLVELHHPARGPRRLSARPPRPAAPPASP